MTPSALPARLRLGAREPGQVNALTFESTKQFTQEGSERTGFCFSPDRVCFGAVKFLLVLLMVT